MRRLMLISAALVLLLCGCGQQSEQPNPAADEPNTTTFFAMDTVMDVSVYGDAALLDAAEARVNQLEALFSVTQSDSEIARANQGQQVALSEDTATVLSGALDICQRTGGALDPSVYPVVRSWGFTTDNYRVPDKEEIDQLLEHVDYQRIHFDPDGRMLQLDGSMEIDLGSVAKGYTGDQLIALLRDAGVTSALLNLGGNVQVLGAKPDGSPWRIAIQDPMGDGNLGLMELTDKAVITSGGYERYFEQDGVTYWHIIDPATGYPARSGLISVTIVGDEGLVCDGLSTSLFVLGLDNAAALWANSNDFEAVFVLDDGSIFITEGLADCFTLLGNYENAPLSVIRRS